LNLDLEGYEPPRPERSAEDKCAVAQTLPEILAKNKVIPPFISYAPRF